MLRKFKKRRQEKRDKIQQPPPKGGLVVGYEQLGQELKPYGRTHKHTKEKLLFLDDDMHSLILGTTRSGKTRSLFLQSIGFIGLSGESMIISDPKGELHEYTSEYLKTLGYKVYALNFKTPTKSQSYNFLQPVIDALDSCDIPKAVELIWDITSSLVPKSNRGEPIWENGEASIIAGGIMSVLYDNMPTKHDGPERAKHKRTLQNLTNVYYFISVMFKAGEKGKMPIDKYIEDKGTNHPATQLFAVAQTAPARTRGSFLTAALGKLRLFISPYIYNMTYESDFKLGDIGNEKHAVFIILPDGKATYNELASLFVYQQYQALLENADNRGGRLPVRTNFMLEEFGNFTKIPSFVQMLTVGGGRGIRFNLVVQDYQQLDDTYGREQAGIIRGNCHCLIYLLSTDPNTNADISKRLGKYTTSSYGRSNNTTSARSINSSASLNLIARELLTPDEVQKIERPFVLVMLSGKDPAMMIMPDVSKWFFNDMFGMGDKAHNEKIRMYRSGRMEGKEQIEIIYWKELAALYSEKSSENQKNAAYTNNFLSNEDSANYPASHEIGDEDAYDELSGDEGEAETVQDFHNAKRHKQIMKGGG